MDSLTTVSAVIDALGGNTPAARLIGCPSTTVGMWRYRDRFPPQPFLVMQAELRRRGLTAPPSLWGITEPERHK